MALKAFQIPEIPNFYNGFVSPTHNVATEDRGGIVLSGENPAGLLYSSSMKSFTDSERIEYTNHRFGDGEIVIQLGQPYYVGSLRLLLWDSENRSYRFYVQTSLDRKNWVMAVDMREKDMSLSSVNVFKFPQRLVLYVKIIGTKCSIEEDEVRITLDCIIPRLIIFLIINGKFEFATFTSYYAPII